MSTASLYDSKRRLISLGKQMASAGEGRILELADGSNRVAKVYHRASPLKAEKLRYMTQVCNERLTSLAAWPTETLHTPGGEIVGFLMPRIASAREIHTLYSPRDRKSHFPEASWAFLIRAASNTARAFAVLHEHGHIVGDVNHGNVLVSSKATVALVDCDSFQVQSPQRCFLCEVGVATHTAPELQDANFASVVRTRNHDAFGLAVMIFQLLFMGRHPFSGGFLGAGEMPIERAIKELRFAYGDGARARQMQPPPNTLPLQVVATDLAFLFERAFSKEGRDSGRPTAQQWITALDGLEKQLRTCSVNSRHVYHKSQAECHWCKLEAKTGVTYFTVGIAAQGATFPPLADIDTLWRRIEAIVVPVVPLEILAASTATPTASYLEMAEKRKSFMWKATHPLSVLKARKEATARKAGAEHRIEELKRLWALPNLNERFSAARGQFEDQRKYFHALDTERQNRVDQLASQARERQLRRHLESVPIRAGIVSGIGPAKATTLHSYGLDTAYDLTPDRILVVPGFGPVIATRLLDWRRQVEARFRFDPSRSIDPQDVLVIDSDIYSKRKLVIASLESAPAALHRILQDMEQERGKIRAELRQTSQHLAQAQADLSAIA